MDDRRTACPLSDAELDRAIRDELAVDPSPAFLARVRAQVANQPEPWRMPFAAWVAGCAAVAAAVIVLFVGHRPDRVTSRVESSLAARQIGSQTSSLPGAAPNRVAESFAVRRQPARPIAAPDAAAGPRAAEPFLPRPLIDARESQALRALIFGVRTGSIDLSPTLKPPAVEPTEPQPIADIEIAPIAIDPIAPFDGAQGARP